jgi:riboflavin synthase
VFTGLVEARRHVARVQERGTGLRLVVRGPELPAWTIQQGESICVSGACLSVAALLDPATGAELPWGSPRADLAFDVSAETLARTWFGRLREGSEVNLERALQVGARLDGHFVSGHVDGIGRVSAIADSGDGGRRIELEVPPELERFLVDKGSITVDGVSLTVVEPRGRRFSVALIPLTLAKTTLGAAREGDAVNLEADVLGKWVDALLAARR